MRLPVGTLLIKTIGDIQSSDTRIILYDGTIKGFITTKLGSISFDLYVHYVYNVISININTNGNETNPYMEFHPANSTNYKDSNTNYILIQSKNYSYCSFKIKDEGEYSVVYISEEENKNRIKYFITITDINNTSSSLDTGIEILNKYMKQNYNDLYEQHKQYWNDYFSKSYLSLSDKRLESFYWIGLYKMGCTMSCKTERCNLLDDMGMYI